MTTTISYPRGAWLMDTRHKRVGQMMDDSLHGILYLRAPSGGREWPATPHQVRPATPDEQRAAGVEGERKPGRRVFRVGPYVVQEKRELPC
ncbi:hypothetical protein ACFY1P_21480 [Streptomyces sp. NPDC001407]|uniref:hypothetical protein n=1 Tax=unclassified Streptomyces TaxID=2593676 RepID=UPI0034096E0D